MSNEYALGHECDKTGFRDSKSCNNLTENPAECEWEFPNVLVLWFQIGLDGLKDQEFRWNSDCDAEMNYLNSCLTSSPILANIKPNKDFVINCQAAGSSGCGLSDPPDKRGREIACCKLRGKAVTKAHMRWTPAQLELSALCLALKKIDIYAVHRHVTVNTDHTNILHLGSWLPQGQRERRMIYFLSQFSLTVKYIHGCRNLCSDSLSRCFNDMPENDKQEFLPTAEEEK